MFRHLAIVILVLAIGQSAVRGETSDLHPKESDLYVAIVPIQHGRLAMQGLDAPGVVARVCRVNVGSKREGPALDPVVLFNNIEVFSSEVAPDRSLTVLSGHFCRVDSGKQLDGKYVIKSDRLDVKFLADQNDLPLALPEFFIPKDGKYQLAYWVLTNEFFARARQAPTNQERLKIAREAHAESVMVNPDTLERIPAPLDEWNHAAFLMQLDTTNGFHFKNHDLATTPVTIGPPADRVKKTKTFTVWVNDASFLVFSRDDGGFLLLNRKTNQWSEIAEGETLKTFQYQQVWDHYLVFRDPPTGKATATTWRIYDLASRRSWNLTLRASGKKDQLGRILMTTPEYILAVQLTDLIYIPRNPEGGILPEKQWKVLVTDPDVPYVRVAFFGPKTPPPARVYPDDRPLTPEELEKVCHKEE